MAEESSKTMAQMGPLFVVPHAPLDKIAKALEEKEEEGKPFAALLNANRLIRSSDQYTLPVNPKFRHNPQLPLAKSNFVYGAFVGAQKKPVFEFLGWDQHHPRNQLPIVRCSNGIVDLTFQREEVTVVPSREAIIVLKAWCDKRGSRRRNPINAAYAKIHADYLALKIKEEKVSPKKVPPPTVAGKKEFPSKEGKVAKPRPSKAKETEGTPQQNKKPIKAVKRRLKKTGTATDEPVMMEVEESGGREGELQRSKEEKEKRRRLKEKEEKKKRLKEQEEKKRLKEQEEEAERQRRLEENEIRQKKAKRVKEAEDRRREKRRLKDEARKQRLKDILLEAERNKVADEWQKDRQRLKEQLEKRQRVKEEEEKRQKEAERIKKLEELRREEKRSKEEQARKQRLKAEEDKRSKKEQERKQRLKEEEEKREQEAQLLRAQQNKRLDEMMRERKRLKEEESQRQRLKEEEQNRQMQAQWIKKLAEIREEKQRQKEEEEQRQRLAKMAKEEEEKRQQEALRLKGLEERRRERRRLKELEEERQREAKRLQEYQAKAEADRAKKLQDDQQNQMKLEPPMERMIVSAGGSSTGVPAPKAGPASDPEEDDDDDSDIEFFADGDADDLLEGLDPDSPPAGVRYRKLY